MLDHCLEPAEAGFADAPAHPLGAASAASPLPLDTELADGVECQFGGFGAGAVDVEMMSLVADVVVRKIGNDGRRGAVSGQVEAAGRVNADNLDISGGSGDGMRAGRQRHLL